MLEKNAGGGVERREHSYTVGGNIIWGSHYGSTVKKLNTELPYDYSNPTPEKSITQKIPAT